MDYDNRNVVDELRGRIIDYITNLDPDARDLNMLDSFDYYALIDRYKKIFGEGLYGNLFDQTLQNYIDDYRASEPESTLSDVEIIYATDALNPMNYFGVIEKSIASIYHKLTKLQEDNGFLNEHPDILSKNNNDYELLKKNNEKQIIVSTRAIEKYRRLMNNIQEIYGIGKER